MMDDETRRLLAEFVAAAKRLDTHALAPPTAGLGRWLDFRVNVGTLLTLLVLVGGGGIAIRDQVHTALAVAERNAAELRRVEADSRARDTQLEGELKERFQDHMRYQHSQRGGPSSSSDARLFDEGWWLAPAGGR